MSPLKRAGSLIPETLLDFADMTARNLVVRGHRRERREFPHDSGTAPQSRRIIQVIHAVAEDLASADMGRPTLRIASMNNAGLPQRELKKIAVTLTAIAAIAQTG